MDVRSRNEDASYTKEKKRTRNDESLLPILLFVPIIASGFFPFCTTRNRGRTTEFFRRLLHVVDENVVDLES